MLGPPIVRFAKALSATRAGECLRAVVIDIEIRLRHAEQSQAIPSIVPCRSRIQGMAGAVIQEMLDCAGMRISKIENVNEVAHAGSVARIVVGAGRKTGRRPKAV